MSRRQIADLFAGGSVFGRQTKEIPNLVEWETEITCSADEAQPTGVLPVIRAIVPFRTRWSGKQPDLFVIPDRDDFHARSLCQLTDA